MGFLQAALFLKKVAVFPALGCFHLLPWRLLRCLYSSPQPHEGSPTTSQAAGSEHSKSSQYHLQLGPVANWFFFTSLCSFSAQATLPKQIKQVYVSLEGAFLLRQFTKHTLHVLHVVFQSPMIKHGKAMVRLLHWLFCCPSMLWKTELCKIHAGFHYFLFNCFAASMYGVPKIHFMQNKCEPE